MLYILSFFAPTGFHFTILELPRASRIYRFTFPHLSAPTGISSLLFLPFRPHNRFPHFTICIVFSPPAVFAVLPYLPFLRVYQFYHFYQLSATAGYLPSTNPPLNQSINGSIDVALNQRPNRWALQ